MRAYMRTRARATHFSGIGFSGNRQGSNPPPVDRGRLKFFLKTGGQGPAFGLFPTCQDF